MTDDEIQSFFGRPKHQVNPLLLRVGTAQSPDWLRGKSRLYELPRYSIERLEFRVSLAIEEKVVSNIVRAIPIAVERCEGMWNMDQDGFSFETITDATLFRLKL